MRAFLLAATLALPLAACSQSSADAAPASKKAVTPEAIAAAQAQKKPAARPDADGRIEIVATRSTFEPSRIEVEGGKPVTLVFTREIEKTCMHTVVFPDLDIEKEIPVGEKVEIEVTPEAGGTIRFQCPMGMGKSMVVGLPKA